MKQNLLDNLPKDLPEELFEQILTGKSFRVERIVSDGHSSADDHWYDQDNNEWVLLLSGSAQLELETNSQLKVVDLLPGDHLMIPSHCRHRVACTDAHAKTV